VYIAAYDNRENLPSYFIEFFGNTTCYCDLNFISPLSDYRRGSEVLKKFAPKRNEIKTVCTADISQLSHVTALFDSVFTNFSTNPHEFERACFLRWFALNGATTTVDDDDYVCMVDTDFLVGMSPEQILSNCQQQSGIESLQLIAEWSSEEPSAFGPEISIMTKSFLFGFCEYLLTRYFSEGNKQQLIKDYFRRVGSGLGGGICDMRALSSYCRESSFEIFNLHDLTSAKMINNLEVFLQSTTANGVSWQMLFKQDGQSLITENDTIPILGTHFQGRAKSLMPQAWRPDGVTSRLTSEKVQQSLIHHADEAHSKVPYFVKLMRRGKRVINHFRKR
jgi:hypothetical protein